MKVRHLLRILSAAVGIILLGVGIADAFADILPHLGATWLVGGGIILVLAAVRKLPGLSF